MSSFDYGAEAELFPGVARPSRRRPVGYRRFAKASEAIRFAIEELPLESFVGAALEVGEQRFDSHGIRRLYESSEYPLARREPAGQASAFARGRAAPSGRPSRRRHEKGETGS
jgi:hypothetical protein